MFSNHVYKIIILPTWVIRTPNLEIFLFLQHNSTGGGNLERQTIRIIIIYFFYDRAKSECALFLVEKVPLNCSSAIKSLLHASVNSLSTIVQKVSVL
jgi:hypothetical protein